MKTKNHRVAGLVAILALGAILAAPAPAVTRSDGQRAAVPPIDAGSALPQPTRLAILPPIDAGTDQVNPAYVLDERGHVVPAITNVTTTTRAVPAVDDDGSPVLRTALITLTGIGLAALLGVVLAIRQRRLVEAA